MRLILVSIICLICASVQAQSIKSKVGIQTIYMPKLKVQEAFEHNVQAVGLRWMISNYDWSPAEFGLHAYLGYGEVARASFGGTLAYLLATLNTQNIKVGVSFSKIDLREVDQNKNGIGPNVGDVRFIDAGNELKPYIEWQWNFSRFSSFSGFEFGMSLSINLH